MATKDSSQNATLTTIPAIHPSAPAKPGSRPVDAYMAVLASTALLT